MSLGQCLLVYWLIFKKCHSPLQHCGTPCCRTYSLSVSGTVGGKPIILCTCMSVVMSEQLYMFGIYIVSNLYFIWLYSVAPCPADSLLLVFHSFSDSGSILRCCGFSCTLYTTIDGKEG